MLKEIKKTVLFSCLMLFLLVQTSVFAADILHNQWGMNFVKIPSGTFKMGLHDREHALKELPNAKENELKDELPQHEVKISEAFYMGQTEVTQGQWLSIMENRPGAQAQWEHSNWKELPVTAISWFMAQRFVEEINKMDKNYLYRLPTEAEWEYVARAGSDGYRPVPLEVLEEYAWFIKNSGDLAHPVGSKKANKFGVYDMLGNVWEWTDDWYASDIYTKGLRVDPKGAKEGFAKVRRGGSYHCPLHLTRPGYREANKPEVGYEVVGFRVVIEKK